MDAAPAVEIVWTQAQGGERCIGRDELATKVQAAVGQSPQTVSPDGLPDKAIVRGSIGKDEGGEDWAATIEVRRGDPSGARLARMALKPQPNDNGDSSHSVALAGAHDTDDLCLVFKGGPGEPIRLNHLDFS